MEKSIYHGFIEIEGIKIMVIKENNYDSKATIVFLHDSLGCIELWRDFPKKLSEITKCNILIYDRQGYGKSDNFTIKREKNYLEKEADTLNKILNKLELKNVILFGHSDGGSIALLTASKYPNKIIGIITEGAHIFVEDITLEGIKKAVENYKTANLKQKLAKYHENKVQDIFDAWTKTWLSKEFRDWNIENFLPNIKCQSLIIQGENDEYGSIKQVDSIINQVNGESIKFIVTKTGHSPHKEKELEVLNKSSDFIKTILK